MPFSYPGITKEGVAKEHNQRNLNINSNETSQTKKPEVFQRVQISFQVQKPKYRLSDLIVSEEANDTLTTIINASECHDKVFIDWDLKSVMSDRQNLLVNIYGAPGTGKTMAAHAIASGIGKGIICVNYAEIESKYVGETSKNLNELFRFALTKDAVIFFDEADAFLSKRVTNMNNSTDVSVNQTRSVLLTLLNDYKGMVVFATNFISNYDQAFMRRIQYHVKLDLPNKELREKLWKRYIPQKMPAIMNYVDIAEKYDKISGSDVSSAVLKAALKAAKNQMQEIPQELFEEAIKEIISSKEANNGYSVVTRPVSEEYALSQINNHGGKI